MIETIVLRSVLPDVFAGEDGFGHSSDVWKTSLTLHRGKRYLITAESGTGKSSLCSYLYGNRKDYRGEILFDDKDIRDFSISQWSAYRRRALALLPQEMRLFPELTVLDNIRLKNSLTDFRTESEILRMLAELEVDSKANIRAGLLSIGQQQRVALVRALCQPMDFLILDEPVSHLDARNNEVAAEMVMRETSAQGAGVLVTSVGNHLAITDFISIQL